MPSKKPAPKKDPEKVRGKPVKPSPRKKAVSRKTAQAIEASQDVKSEPAAPVDEDADTQGDELCGLSIRAARMVDLYLVSMNASQAYVEAGYTAASPAVAHAGASRLLASVKGRAYLAKRSKAMFDRLAEEQDRLLETLTFNAYADPRELTEHLVGACRHCYGRFNRYQYTAGEWDEKMTAYAEKQERAADDGKPAPKEPDPKGGTGYDFRKPPNPECPECFGHGVGKPVLKDTRNLSPAALALFAGVKWGKDGIEIKMHDQGKARETLAKIRKLYEDGTSVHVNVDPVELDKLFGQSMQQAHERMRKMREERFGTPENPPAGSGG